MSSLPASLQVAATSFTNVGFDLIRPITVKAMVNKRAKMKVWIVIFLCLNLKAVYMEVAPENSTQDFLLVYHSHSSQRGIPSFAHSDRVSQLIAASRNLSEDLPLYDWDAISASTGKKGTTWKFAPAGAQWRNGAIEAFIKKFKPSFCHIYQNNEFNYAELDCAVKRIANMVNNRPVSAKRTKSYSTYEDFLSPLTPNMLVTGRNGLGPPQEYLYEYDTDPRIRKSYFEDMCLVVPI